MLALRRSAYSTNIKTRADFSCAFFDAELRVGRAGLRPAGAPRLDGRAGAAGGPRLRPGEPRARRRDRSTTIPYPSGVHLNDVTLIAPVYHDGRAARLRRQPRPPRRRRRRRAGQHRRLPRGLPGGRDHPAGQAGRRRARSSTTSSGWCWPRSARSTRRPATSAPRSPPTPPASGAFRRSSTGTAARRSSRRWTSCSTTPSGARAAELAALPHGVYEAEGFVDNDGYTDEPVRLRARGRRSDDDGVLFDTDRLRPAAAGARQLDLRADVLRLRLRPQVPDRPGHPGQRRLLPAGHGRRARGHGRPTARWPAAGRRRLGDANAARRRALQGAPPGACPSGCRRAPRR